MTRPLPLLPWCLYFTPPINTSLLVRLPTEHGKQLQINYLRPIKAGKLTAVGQLVQRGRTVGLAECDITDAQGRLVARASGTCLTVPDAGP